MARFWIVVLPTLYCVYVSNSFILPLTKTDGGLNTEHLLGHVTLLEQTVKGLQQTVINLQQTVTRLTLSETGEIATLKTEISNLKANQQKLDARTFDLQKQIQPNNVMTVGTSFTNEINAVKTEIRRVSNEVTSLTLRWDNATRDYQSFSSMVNSTGAARDAKLKALDQKYQILSSQVNSTGAARDAKLVSLDQRFKLLTIQVNTKGAAENMTGAVPDVLGQVLKEVHNAENDRLLLHSFVSELNKTVSELNTNSNNTTMELSAKIAQLDTGEGFDAWLGPTSVNVTDGATIKFDDVQYNVDGGYNASTGVFTAPVEGTYFFWTQVKKLTGADLVLHIIKRGAAIGHSYIPIDEAITGSVFTTARVKAGEQVSVAIRGAKSIACCYTSRFGGVLMYKPRLNN